MTFYKFSNFFYYEMQSSRKSTYSCFILNYSKNKLKANPLNFYYFDVVKISSNAIFSWYNNSKNYTKSIEGLPNKILNNLNVRIISSVGFLF